MIAGIFKIRKQKIEVPLIEGGNQTAIMREGEEFGQRGSEK